jgi:hypothetical protein
MGAAWGAARPSQSSECVPGAARQPSEMLGNHSYRNGMAESISLLVVDAPPYRNRIAKEGLGGKFKPDRPLMDFSGDREFS